MSASADRCGGRASAARLLAGARRARRRRASRPLAPFGRRSSSSSRDGDDATLLLPRDGRVLEHGRAGRGARGGGRRAARRRRPAHDADRLRRAPPTRPTARQLGDDWRDRCPTAAVRLYLHRDAAPAPWRLVAAVHRDGGRRRVAGRVSRLRRAACRAIDPPRQSSDAGTLRSAARRCRRSRSTCRSSAEVFSVRIPPTAVADHARGAARTRGRSMAAHGSMTAGAASCASARSRRST